MPERYVTPKLTTVGSFFCEVRGQYQTLLDLTSCPFLLQSWGGNELMLIEGEAFQPSFNECDGGAGTIITVSMKCEETGNENFELQLKIVDVIEKEGCPPGEGALVLEPHFLDAPPPECKVISFVLDIPIQQDACTVPV